MKIKYRISKNEDIDCLSYGTIILNAKIICLGDNDDALIYLPRKLKYIAFDTIESVNSGCGSLSFAVKGRDDICQRSKEDYINVTNKKYEPHKSRKKMK
jgi:hypothetical protein